MAPTDVCAFDGTVVFGGLSSLEQGSMWYQESVESRNSISLCVDHINRERQGLQVGGQRLAVRFQAIDDGSSLYQVTNATAHISRTYDGAHFLLGPFGSSLTRYAAMQAYADGKIMLAPSSSVTAVIGSNPLLFGTLSSADKLLAVTARAIVAAAELCDQQDAPSAEGAAYQARMLGPSMRNPMCTDAVRATRCAAGGGSCRASLRAGLLTQDAAFTRSTCAAGPAILEAMGIEYATETLADGTQSALTVTVGAGPGCKQSCPEAHREYVREMVDALRALRDSGVTLVLACTYFRSAEAMVDALHEMRFSPLAVTVSAAVGQQQYRRRVAAGWWQGEYVLEPVDWHASDTTTVGAFTGWTSAEFAARYMASNPSAHVGYIGASAFASCVALAHAIETAGSLNTSAVAAALARMEVADFFKVLRFDERGQSDAEAILTQMLLPNVTDEQSNADRYEEAVYRSDAWDASTPPAARNDAGQVRLSFPMPTWEYRECVRSTSYCSGNGECSLEGVCVCQPRYAGVDCSVFEHHVNMVLVWILASVLIVLLLVCVGVALWRREVVRLSTARRLRWVDSNAAVHPPHLHHGPSGYHIFLSHVWVTGQDQNRLIKNRLLETLPGVRVFLDVDDLHEGKGANYVDMSNAVLCFVSRGYFESPNCMRELLRALLCNTSTITVCESDVARGAMTAQEARDALVLADARYGTQWNDAFLSHEVEDWLEGVAPLEEVQEEEETKTSRRGGPPIGEANLESVPSDARAAVPVDATFTGSLRRRLDQIVSEISGASSRVGSSMWTRKPTTKAADALTVSFNANGASKTEQRVAAAVEASRHHAVLQGLCSGEPVADELHSMLYAEQRPIEWNRLNRFQMVTIQMIAERLLPKHHRAVYIRAILHAQNPPARWLSLSPPSRFHLCYSAHNPGALDLLRELCAVLSGHQHFEQSLVKQAPWRGRRRAQAERGSRRGHEPSPLERSSGSGAVTLTHEPYEHASQWASLCGGASAHELHVTEGVARLAECRHMLVYLTSRTWTSGGESARFAEEVRAAIQAGVHLLLVHEMPGEGHEERCGVEFGLFFANPRGHTPSDLINLGIYSEIAMPLKGGRFRAAGIAQLTRAIAKSGATLPPMLQEGSRSARSRRTAQPRRSTMERLRSSMSGSTVTSALPRATSQDEIPPI